MYAIWLLDKHLPKQDWLREHNYRKYKPILVFENEEDAKKRACEQYGFEIYEELVEGGWAEVREFPCSIPTK